MFRRSLRRSSSRSRSAARSRSLSIIGGLSIDTDRSGRAAWGSVIAAFLGIPGRYDVVWEPGLWIVRGIIAAILLAWLVPDWIDRRRARLAV